MIKTTCICDRCGREFPESEAVAIKIVSSMDERNGRENKKATGGLLLGLSKSLRKNKDIRDYCPDCVNEIKHFIENSGNNKTNS